MLRSNKKLLTNTDISTLIKLFSKYLGSSLFQIPYVLNRGKFVSLQFIDPTANNASGNVKNNIKK